MIRMSYSDMIWSVILSMQQMSLREFAQEQWYTTVETCHLCTVSGAVQSDRRNVMGVQRSEWIVLKNIALQQDVHIISERLINPTLDNLLCREGELTLALIWHLEDTRIVPLLC